MHKLLLQDGEYSNLLSYGNNVNVITFEDGLTWIKGPNGVGKSVVIEFLTFVLFGKAYRDINKKDIKNNSNKSSLKTLLRFLVIRGEVEDAYIAKRTMTTSGSGKFLLFKNGSETPMDGMSQKIFETEILGFNQTIFENVISLNTIQTTPFIDMEPASKRKLVESVLTLHIDKYKEANKKALKEAQIKFVAAESDVEKYTKDVEELKDILAKLKEEKENVIKELKDKLATSEKEIVEFKSEQAILEKDRDAFKEKGIALKTNIDALGNVEQAIADCKILISRIDDNSKLYDRKDVLDKELDKANADYKKLSEELDKIAVFDKARFEEIVNRLHKINDTSLNYTLGIHSDENVMKGIEKDAKELVHGVPCPTCGKPSTEDDIESIKKDYREKWKKYNEECKEKKALQAPLLVEIETLEKEKEEMSKSKDVYIPLKAKYDSAVLMKDKAQKDFNAAKKAAVDDHYELETLWKDLMSQDMEGKPEVEKEMAELEAELPKKQEMTKELDDIRSKTIAKIEAVKTLQSNIARNEASIIEINADIKSKNEKDIDDAFNATKTKFENTTGDLERAHKRITKYSDEVSITKYIEKMYNDDGIKKIVLGIFVPNLNKAIAYNLRLFEMPFSIEFNDAMEYKFGSRFGLADVYGGLSQGQRRKLNFAISIAFRDFVTAIADFKINILFLDEVLDISTDDEALNHMILLLKEKIDEIGGIYLMTHRGENFTEHFDRTLEVSHDGRYSSIAQVS